MPAPSHWANPISTRSMVVLEIAEEFVTKYNDFLQAKILLRVQGQPQWEFALYGSSTLGGIDEVLRGDSAIGIVNPATTLALAYLGMHPFRMPEPVRTLAVIPTHDQYAFAVRSDLGLTSFEEIGTKRAPLRVSVRKIPDHSLHVMLDHVMEAAGFSASEFRTWGGDIRLEGSLPYPGSPKFEALRDGSIDAIFDEAVDYWVNEAVEAGCTILPVSDATLAELEKRGFRRGVIEKSRYPALPADVQTVDFSGWPIYVHADATDELVTRFCAALDARKSRIPWQGEGPLPLERMCLDARDTPQLVPLHPAAERYWRDCGYLPAGT